MHGGVGSKERRRREPRVLVVTPDHMRIGFSRDDTCKGEGIEGRRKNFGAVP